MGVDIIIAAAPPERAGAASAISETTQELGGALGIALLGSIGTAVYRSRMIDAVPATVPPQAADAARYTLGGAAGSADLLPPGLLTTANEAFTAGLQLAAVVNAVALAAVAVAATVVLRRVRAGSDDADPPHTAPTQVGLG
ncbi:hypothetical protein WEH80_13750 [Actinomycetes bacterium KLBMP 9759]